MKAGNAVADKSKAFALRIIKLYPYLHGKKKDLAGCRGETEKKKRIAASLAFLAMTWLDTAQTDA